MPKDDLASLPAQGGERAEVTWVNDASRGGVMSANYDELVGRLEAQTIVSKDGDLYRENRNPDGPEAAAAIRALEGENFTLAAGQCLFDDGTGLTGDEGGTPYCAMKAARQSAEAKLEAVRKLIEEAHFECKQGCGGAARWTLEEALAALDTEKAGG